MNKTAIKNFAVWARQKLISDITYKAGMLGITENGIAEKLPQSTNDLHFFDIGTKNYAEISGIEIKQREALVKAIKTRERSFKNFKEAFENVVEEVAYTWFNRLIAIRFMEVNDYLPSGIRVLSSENRAKLEPDFVTSPFDTDLEFTPYEQDRVIQLKDENKLDELFRMLFIKQCNKLHDILPELFEKTDDYTELLLTISFTDKDGVVYRLVHDIDEDDFNVEKEGQVEIIGWMYQYYNIEPKDQVFANLKKNVKITKDKIPAATQLFTPDWIVRYMVENSLGRLWIEHCQALGGLDSEYINGSYWEWKYYLDESEQEPEVEEKLKKMRENLKTLSPEDIKIIDPCMGSGHILVYAFDVLMRIYEAQGYTQRDAARLIVEKNIFGLDIDKRAYQLSYFAVMMKARQYNRRILNGEIKPNLFAINDSTAMTREVLDFIANGNQKILADLQSISRDLTDATEYGSIINVEPVDFEAIYSRFDEIRDSDFSDLFGSANHQFALTTILPLIKQAEAMAQKYDVVCTNPPYMGSSGMNNKLSDYVKKYYPDSKSDLFAVFIERGINMTKRIGYNCMVTMQSWMFLSSFEKMRERIIRNHTITNLMHMENMVMGIAFGTAVTVFNRVALKGYKGTYNQIKLSDIDNKTNIPTDFPIENNRFSQISTENFSKIPGSPIAYWVSENWIKTFNSKLIQNLCEIKQGLATCNNSLFLRSWYEVSLNKIGFNFKSNEETVQKVKKWFPYNKGGGYRKWYGNCYDVVNWKNKGEDIHNYNNIPLDYQSAPVRAKRFYFKSGITYGLITSSSFSARNIDGGFIFDVGGSMLFPDINTKFYILGFLSTKLTQLYLNVINPTLNYQVGDVGKLPMIISEKYKPQIESFVNENINISKSDWDSFETSWDFKIHPLIEYKCGAGYADEEWSYSIQDAFDTWEADKEEIFNLLKRNEEELNRIFIDIYGLQDELTPDVSDKDITVYRVFDSKDDVPESMKGSNYILTKHDVVVSLISYAVGCMLGRYSLDVEGIAYAGGEWDDSKYKTFIPDADNCIPITDEEYFEDDIVGLFCVWLKKVYGERTLEENLDFIADALGNKGKTSREVIRNYFLNDFIKDHIKTYQKRPIYWLFDSGKQNGFKALCYMHRWNADTTGNMRVEYLHRMQRVYEKEIQRMQEIIDNSRDNKEIANATKRKEKLQKQIKETKEYDAKVAHLALSRIDIDLDDGVKVNYEKVQAASDGKKMQILAKM